MSLMGSHSGIWKSHLLVIGSGVSRQRIHSVTENKTGYWDWLGLCLKNIVIHCNCNTFYAAMCYAGSINVYLNTTFPLTEAPHYGL